MNPLPVRAIGGRRAVVVGAGSFGTAIALLLQRSGARTTLQSRTEEQANTLIAARENRTYLPGVELPRELRIEPRSAGLARADLVFLGVPSHGLREVIAALPKLQLPHQSAVISLAKGLVPPDGSLPSAFLSTQVGAQRVAVMGGPAHAREMVTDGAGLVAASLNTRLAVMLADIFTRSGVVCEHSRDPVGVELAGVAKNAAALAAGATVPQGLNAAGAAAAHIFLEVWSYAERRGALPETMIGLAGTGDLVATALAPQSRSRRAGELLANGISATEIPDRIGQAVEALDLVPLLARAFELAHIDAPVTNALKELIEGKLPLEEWVAQVRATVPRQMFRAPRGWFKRLIGSWR